MPSEPTFVGIDLGASALHVVTLVADGERLSVQDARVVMPDSLEDLDLERAVSIAIDAPAEPSLGCHVDDTARSPKFRTARCGEIALGEQAGIWVPWTTPRELDAAAPWMRVGFATWAECRRQGHVPIEVYPAGAFRVLADGKIPSKVKPAGLAVRRDLLARLVTPPIGFAMWSHDGIDAMVAAATAAAHARGTATAHGHDGPTCDGSAVWLPPPLDRDPTPIAR